MSERITSSLFPIIELINCSSMAISSKMASATKSVSPATNWYGPLRKWFQSTNQVSYYNSNPGSLSPQLCLATVGCQRYTSRDILALEIIPAISVKGRTEGMYIAHTHPPSKWKYTFRDCKQITHEIRNSMLLGFFKNCPLSWVLCISKL